MSIFFLIYRKLSIVEIFTLIILFILIIQIFILIIVADKKKFNETSWWNYSTLILSSTAIMVSNIFINFNFKTIKLFCIEILFKVYIKFSSHLSLLLCECDYLAFCIKKLRYPFFNWAKINYQRQMRLYVDHNSPERILKYHIIKYKKINKKNNKFHFHSDF